MALPAPAPRMAAGALLFLLLLLPTSSAQVPTPAQLTGNVVAFAVVCPTQYLEPARTSPAEVVCLVEDLTRDAPAAPGGAGVPVVPHSVNLKIANQVPSLAEGWKAELSQQFIPIVSGQNVPVTVRAIVTPQVATSNMSFQILADYTGPGGQTSNLTLDFRAQVQRFDFAQLEIANGGTVQKAGQNQLAKYVVTVTNNGVYPDIYHVQAASTDGDVALSVPASVYVPPQSTRNFTITALTPHGKFYEFGRSVQIHIRVTSGAGTFTDTRTAILNIQGAYIATYWVPVSILVLISGVIVTRRAREAAQIRALERGRPRAPRPTPRQAVLLAELKRQDKARYQERLAADQAAYKERRKSWLGIYRERRAQDRAEAREAHREFKQARAAQKEKRVEELRARKEAKLAERDAAKEERQQRKLLGKKRKQLDAQTKKLDAKQAKVDAKQAKADAKRAALDAKAAAKAAKADAKAAKKGKKPDA